MVFGTEPGNKNVNFNHLFLLKFEHKNITHNSIAINGQDTCARIIKIITALPEWP